MANERRSYHLPSTGEPYRGIETVIRVNGLLLNDRRYLDNYRVTEVTGMDDPDLNDVREAGTEVDGEYAFNSYYSGRTITLRGEVRAGNFGKLREMQGDLKYATNLLQETTVDFLFNDTEEDFTDTAAVNDYTVAGTAGAISNWSIANGKLFATRGDCYLRHSKQPYYNFENTIHFRTGATIPSNVDFFSLGRGRLSATGSFVMGGWRASLSEIYVGSKGTPVGNTYSQYSTDTATLAVSTDYWLRFSGNGSEIHTRLFAANPDDDHVEPTAHAFYSLFATTVQMPYATIANAEVGIGFASFGTTAQDWRIQDLSFRNHDVPDVRVKARKVGKVDMPDSQTNHNVTRPFMLTMRASNPLLESRVTNYLTLDADDNNIVFPSGGITLPTSFSVNTETISNLGTYYTYPVVTFYGSMSDPVLTNTETNESISLSIDIADGESVTIDVANRTVYDQAGANKYGYLATDHKWMRLSPGSTELAFGCVSFDALTSARCEIEYRHGWL
jgi:hypothetical protein